MGSSQATFESYDLVEVQLARGATISGRCLTISEATRFLRLQQFARQGSPTAIEKILEEFPAAVGIADQRFTPIELLQEVLPAFLSHSGARQLMATAPGTAAPSSASTT